MWAAEFDALPVTASDARTGAACYLDMRCADADCDAIPVMLSELVSNAARHATGPRRVTVVVDASRVRVAVEDGSRTMPVVMPFDPVRVGGNGMRIVEAFATSWGADQRLGGKTMWSTLDR